MRWYIVTNSQEERVRFPETDDEAVKFQPLLVNGLSNRAPKMSRGDLFELQSVQQESCPKCDALETPDIVWCNGLKCTNSPLRALPARQQHDFEFSRSRKVDRTQRRFIWKQRSALRINASTERAYRGEQNESREIQG